MPSLEMQKERMDQKQLELKIKTLVTHESHIETELIKLQNEVKQIYYDDFKEIRKLQFTLVHNMRYLSRKNWRMRILQDYMDKMKLSVDLAYGGEIGMSDSADFMASVQIKGSTPVKFQCIEHDHDHFFVKMYFDTGSYTSADRSMRNDTTSLLQTMSHLFLVSEHYLDGSPLSMAEVRVIGGITDDCLILVHITLYSYKVINSGNISCVMHGKGRVSFSMERGEMFHMEPRDYCRNKCVEVGYRGFSNKYKNLPSQPSVQPSALQHFFQDYDRDNVPAPAPVLERAHQVAHDVLSADLRENEDLLTQLNAAQTEEPISKIGSYMGYVGVLISAVITIVLVLLCIRCRKKGKAGGGVIVQNIEMRRIRDRDDCPDESEEH
jgi:hypothetical protein